ncbi:MAG: nicotinate-nucleotide adenylyltransferase [Calditrichia bacterium]
MKKIGLFGGTFDPIHNGHLIIAEYLRVELDLEEIWFIPARIHPLKNNTDITSAEDRLNMLKLAIDGDQHFRIDDLELRREGISYTIDTIDALHENYRHLSPEFYFFIGMDNVNELHQWKEPKQILTKSKVVAFGRPGFTPHEKAKEFLPYIRFVHVPLLEISSTFVRKRIREGLSVRYIIADSVFKYIQEKQLYR